MTPPIVENKCDLYTQYLDYKIQYTSWKNALYVESLKEKHNLEMNRIMEHKSYCEVGKIEPIASLNEVGNSFRPSLPKNNSISHDDLHINSLCQNSTTKKTFVASDDGNINSSRPASPKKIIFSHHDMNINLCQEEFITTPFPEDPVSLHSDLKDLLPRKGKLNSPSVQQCIASPKEFKPNLCNEYPDWDRCFTIEKIHSKFLPIALATAQYGYNCTRIGKSFTNVAWVFISFQNAFILRRDQNRILNARKKVQHHDLPVNTVLYIYPSHGLNVIVQYQLWRQLVLIFGFFSVGFEGAQLIN